MRRPPALVALALVAAVGAQFALARVRPDGGPAFAEGAFAAFGGLRSVVAEIVWFRMDRLQDEGRYVELAQLARALTLAEPHTPEVWSFAAWNLAYNVSVMMPTDADRWRWVWSALTLLRDDALALNPRSAELHRELAWLFELKLGVDIDTAAPSYRAEWRRIFEDAARSGRWDELRMDPETLDALVDRFGMKDRADPLVSAVYWALAGMPYANARERAELNEVVRQSVAVYRRRHAEE